MSHNLDKNVGRESDGRVLQVETGEDRASEADASVAGRSREMVEACGSRLLQLSRRTRQSHQPPEFRFEVRKRWLRVIRRRSQRSGMTWALLGGSRERIAGFPNTWRPARSQGTPKESLQRDLQLSEPEVYVTLQRQSRQRRKSMKVIAEATVLSDDVKRTLGKPRPINSARPSHAAR
jgi:hypothetical protein